MSDERFKSVIGKYREAAAERNQRIDDAERERQERAQAEALAEAKWSELKDIILAEVDAANTELDELGFTLHHGTLDTFTAPVGGLQISFKPIRADGRVGFDRLDFVALRDGRVRAGYGTPKEASVSNEFTPIGEFDRDLVRKHLFDFLEANVPSQ